MTTNNEQVSAVPTSTLRAMQALIAVMVSGAVAMSGWSLITLHTLSTRLSSVEAKLSADAQHTGRTIDRIEDELRRVTVRLETKLDALSALLMEKQKQ